MVARIISGKSIKGAIRYNEQKVSKGMAEQILAYNFPSENLSLLQKAARFHVLTSQNPRCKTNAVHISLNFDPKENPDNQQLQQIAMAYLDKIGFAGQPFLLYKHFDAAHPHVHIVTTNIKDGGQRISLHDIGKDLSEPARKEIETEFGLIPAEGRNTEQEMYLKPIAPVVVMYGKSETQASISNVLRTVIPTYKYASLAELNAILKQYNVVADSGAEGTKMQQKGGLQYSLLDKHGKKIGVPIKASSIYLKATLPAIQDRFERNKELKKLSKGSFKKLIDDTIKIEGVTNKEEFAASLSKENISVVFRQNDQGRVYGITFIDHQTKVVFNGSDLGKEYSASRILQRINSESKQHFLSKHWNEQYVRETLNSLDYTKGFPAILSKLYQKGLRIATRQTSEGKCIYIGHYRVATESHMKMDKKWNAYFSVNGMNEKVTAALETKNELYLRGEDYRRSGFVSNIDFGPSSVHNDHHFQKFIEDFLNAPGSYESPTTHSIPRRKRKRHI